MLWITQGKVQDLSLFHIFCISFSMPFDCIKKILQNVSYVPQATLILECYVSRSVSLCFFLCLCECFSALLSLCLFIFPHASFFVLCLFLRDPLFVYMTAVSSCLFFVTVVIVFPRFFFVCMTLSLCFFVCMSMLMFFILLSFPM